MATPIQIRSIDPFSSYHSDNVNRLTRMVSDGSNCILFPTPIDIVKKTDRWITILKGRAIKDDVLIEFTEDKDMLCTQLGTYVDGTTTSWDETGYYYVVLVYTYQKIDQDNINTAEVQLIKPSDRATLYDPEKHLFLKCLDTSWPDYPNSSPIIDRVLDYDPDNPTNKRFGMGGGGLGTNVKITEVNDIDYNIISSDDTIIVTSNANDINLTLPPTSTTTKIIKIIKMGNVSYDLNITITSASGDVIEGNTTITLTEMYDEVTLLPNYIDNKWIEI